MGQHGKEMDGVTSEIDFKTSSPIKFWSSVVLGVLTMIGGSGGVSFLASQEASAHVATEAATIAAKSAAAEAVSTSTAELRGELRKLRDRAAALERQDASFATDVQWIRSSLERIERKL